MSILVNFEALKKQRLVLPIETIWYMRTQYHCPNRCQTLLDRSMSFHEMTYVRLQHDVVNFAMIENSLPMLPAQSKKFQWTTLRCPMTILTL